MVLHYRLHKLVPFLIGYVVKDTFMILVSYDFKHTTVFRHKYIGITIIWIQIESLQLVLNLGHNPLYRHFCKCLYVELLKNYLFINYWHIANPILSGRRLIKSLQPLNILVKNLPRYSQTDFPCIFTVLMML